MERENARLSKLDKLYGEVACVFSLAIDTKGRPPSWEEFADTVLLFLAEKLGAYGSSLRKVIDTNYRTASDYFLKTDILVDAFVSCPWVLERMWKILRNASHHRSGE